MNILQLNTSIRGNDSQSSRLAKIIVERLTAVNPAASLTIRDLASNPQPMLDADALEALSTPAEQRTQIQAARVALDDALITQIQATDILMLAVPMYNFGIPVQLKNWIDAICRAQVTFRYTEQGPQGLLTGKKVYIALTRGGVHRDSASDSQASYLQTVLGFLGLTDLNFIYAEGLAMGEGAAEEAFTQAETDIAALA
ncbi:MAG: NAD(P)H-dependent oxidoreductase [Methylococcaceae bacterium]|jgi:FMN-dependent NADH-azoreductase|nr:NAD(P)H-dependent oxidoreductase [Methylococcaceae bacterium]MDZ4155207.1 NAD(P)H-dependent oxidoreductase [Methylococcales bacterium]MDP2393521.1 NAD(P)H-dependent oxidoreductase [Methylococcaceae bacterium]MDP3021392.1 NAD(P)H-dependent oxidoreductase [Methylococcaceae bacterium]MDP3391018.1 NAD(P)H-dependent oxidoreductase [Methylococcaceae bacterium]